MNGDWKNARAAAEKFALERADYELCPYGEGHINETYLLYRPDVRPRYILQKLNTYVFRKPQEVMENIVGVTSFLRERVREAGGDVNREVLQAIPTWGGGWWHVDENGGFWRAYLFVEDTVSCQLPDSEELFAASAEAFGNFARFLQEYPDPASLHETIPDFHNTPDRYRKLRAALQADVMGRAKEVQKELDFAFAHEEEGGRLHAMRLAGELPTRVTHNDTKLNNVLLDAKSGRGVCVIDLDTVMPGLSAYDFGDSIRFGANSAAEDEEDLSRVALSLPMYRAYVQGFLKAASGAFTPLERETLPLGAKTMTLENGVRFLTDYLEGDVYFRVHRPAHNLVRARDQFRLVESMEEHWDEMRAAVAEN